MWKLWKMGGRKDKYIDAKRKAQYAVCKAKRNAKKGKFTSEKDNKENIFCVTKQMHTENQDVIEEKCIQDEDGNLFFEEASKKLAWKQHYAILFNIEFPWSQNLSLVDPVVGPTQLQTPEDLLKSLRHMKNRKKARTSGVVAEMLKAAPDISCKIIADLMNATMPDLRERFLQVGLTASLLVYLKKMDMRQTGAIIVD